MRARRRLILPWLALAPALAAAQQAAPAQSSAAARQALYQEALLSLAEGRKRDASEALARLIEQEPQHAGAWLDLALIHCSLGHADEAERLFATVETRFSPSRDILELIAEARETGCNRWPAASSLALGLARGSDDNVNQGASNSTFVIELPDGRLELPLLGDFLPKRDQYTLVSGEYTREVSVNGSLGFVQFQARRHDTLRSYDTASAYAGVESPWRFGRWVVRTTGMLGMSTMGGHLYQKQAQAQLRVTPPLLQGPRTEFHLGASATVTSYAALENFDARTFELRAVLAHRIGALALHANAGLLDDQARNRRPGGNRHGGYAGLTLRGALGVGVNGELGYTWQVWNGAAPYAPELLIGQVRGQRTGMARAALSVPVARNQTLTLEARAVRNRENISIFQYNNRQLQLSWQWRLP